MRNVVENAIYVRSKDKDFYLRQAPF
jgi:hypothetical protein